MSFVKRKTLEWSSVFFFPIGEASWDLHQQNHFISSLFFCQLFPLNLLYPFFFFASFFFFLDRFFGETCQSALLITRIHSADYSLRSSFTSFCCSLGIIPKFCISVKFSSFMANSKNVPTSLLNWLLTLAGNASK